MRSTDAKARETRARIVSAAAQQFRANGFAGISIADLMQGVGLTHGGFYAHFASKEELMALACRKAVADMLAVWRQAAEAAPGNGLGAIVALYLSAEHRDQPATGCLMAALGPETARQTQPVRQAVTECLDDVLTTLTEFAHGHDAADRRNQAVRTFSALVGAMVVARAINDRQLSNDFLYTVKTGLAESR